MNKLKKRPFLIVIIVLAFIALPCILYFAGSMYSEYKSDAPGSGETVTVEIEQGEGVWDISGKLKEAELIEHRLIFCLKAKQLGVTGQLRYGTFELFKNAGLKALIDDLISGGAQKAQTMFTVPEGFTIEKIALKLEEEGLFKKEEFLAAVKKDYEHWFLKTIPANAGVVYRLQGFLYPDTYAISEDMTAEDLVVAMLDQFGVKYTKEMEEKANRMGKTTYELVIEASIIERETSVPAEREIVAGVIKNRLDINMPLQVCPSVLYPLTNGIYDVTTVSKEDTLIDSPYNTYQNKGLPVGPIASPGLPSIEAALNPTEHDYLYYHTDPNKNDGSHIFTKTYQEHTQTQ